MLLPKKVLITGSSEGIGLELAKIFDDGNHRITLVSRNHQKLKMALEELKYPGHEILQLDLSHKEDISALCDRVLTKPYDILINNAGVGMYGIFSEMSIGAQIAMMELNMTAVTKLCHTFLQKARKENVIINIASTLGDSSFPGASTYAATKAFIINLSNSLWKEYQNQGIFVGCVCPGATNTGFHKHSGGSSTTFPKFLLQSPESVAQTVYGLAKKRNKPKTISGAMNQFMMFFNRLISNKMMVNLMSNFSPMLKASLKKQHQLTTPSV